VKLWRLSNEDANGIYYDAYNGFVIAAESEEIAREIANEDPGAEGSIWENPQLSSCLYIGEAADHVVEGVVLSDFHAG